MLRCEMFIFETLVLSYHEATAYNNILNSKPIHYPFPNTDHYPRLRSIKMVNDPIFGF